MGLMLELGFHVSYIGEGQEEGAWVLIWSC